MLRLVKLRPTRGEAFRSIDGVLAPCAARRRYVSRADDGAGSPPRGGGEGTDPRRPPATAVTARRRNSPLGERAAPEIRRDERVDRRSEPRARTILSIIDSVL